MEPNLIHFHRLCEYVVDKRLKFQAFDIVNFTIESAQHCCRVAMFRKQNLNTNLELKLFVFRIHSHLCTLNTMAIDFSCDDID